ncbi:hypothetical protein DCAR_0209087 [Daucus carota subsp. sativus]|uniref:Uncharacterized protein n=1 Tax=Daucus carota subsp. sativus TaxID=79200 RepID=A0A166F0R9_DAUCS|nr:hypothetical protein DCAR_0209087 [Daucus carota subsp. sativus]
MLSVSFAIYVGLLSLGYVVATLFFAVVEISGNTIILSFFCQDTEKHQEKARYKTPKGVTETLYSTQRSSCHSAWLH